MLTMDAFRADAFSAVSLTAAVDKMKFTPQLLGSIPGLFVPKPIRTKVVWIEERSNAPALIQTAPRSAPPKVRGREQRDARSFVTKALGEGSRIEADELEFIRAFGSETEEKALASEIARRQFLIGQDFELTLENYRLSVITQAKMLDADGSTIYDWAAEFGQTATGPGGSANPIVNWDLQNASPASGALRLICNQTIRFITRALQGLGGVDLQIGCICGDGFWDALTTHPEVRETYKNWEAAADLRNDVGQAWKAFTFGNIMFQNYRSTDDFEPTSGGVTGTEASGVVGVPSARGAFFPMNAGIFQMAFAPPPKFGFLGTPGQERYSWIVMDEKRDMWADTEVYSYPLAVCTMPSALVTGKRTSGD
jgi:hypothetical protein